MFRGDLDVLMASSLATKGDIPKVMSMSGNTYNVGRLSAESSGVTLTLVFRGIYIPIDMTSCD